MILNQIDTSDGSVVGAEISAFQMKAHHKTVVGRSTDESSFSFQTKSAHTLLQIAGDLSVGSMLLNLKERHQSVETLRQQLSKNISNATLDSSRLMTEVLKIHVKPPPLSNEPPPIEEDDDVVFEGGLGVSPFLPARSPQTLCTTHPRIDSQHLFTFP